MVLLKVARLIIATGECFLATTVIEPFQSFCEELMKPAQDMATF
jgi:hypothetical protein